MASLINEVLKFFIENPIILFLAIVLLIIFIFQNKIVGWFGEHWTRKALNGLPKEKYTLLNDVFIATSTGTHQIDHVIVSKYGIFSIETKQYNGYITGNKYDKNWVRHAGKKKYYYTNPIRQNYGHVKALSELLKIDESKIYNIVCIPSRAKLKIEHDGELVRYDTIKNKILSYNTEVINDVNGIVNQIRTSNITDYNVKREHINNIRENIIDKDINKCPKCGGQLVKRNGKYGSFYGCSNYPKCKYTKK